MYRLVGNYEGYYLNWICKTEGSLYLVGDNLQLFEQTKGKEIFDREFIIKVTANTPKKVNRKTVLYGNMSCDLKSFYLVYIDSTGKIAYCENIKLSVDEKGVISFNLTNILRENRIQFTIPEKARLSVYDKVNMRVNLSFKQYGIVCYLPSRGIAFDGTGSGYIYHLWPDYLSVNGVGINRLLIHSYCVEPIKLAVDEFLQSSEKQDVISVQQMEDLLLDICDGNEFAVQTNDISIDFRRHYNRNVKVKAFGKDYIRQLLKEDSEFAVGSRDKEWLDKMEQVKKIYAFFISKVIISKTVDEVQAIVDTFFPEAE